MYHVYILKLLNNKYYVGFAKNFERRLKGHKDGQVRSTRDFTPLELVTYIALTSKTKALMLEKYLKSGSGFAFRNRHLI